MKRLILFILLSFCLVFSASAWNPMIVTRGVAEVACACGTTVKDMTSQTDDGSNRTIGYNSTGHYQGFQVVSASFNQICKLDTLLQDAGDPSAYYMMASVFDTATNNITGSSLGDSNCVAMANNDAEATFTFTWSTGITLAVDDVVVIRSYSDSNCSTEAYSGTTNYMYSNMHTGDVDGSYASPYVADSLEAGTTDSAVEHRWITYECD